MRLLKIDLCNFRSYYGKHSLDLSQIHSATITGPNGAGKSSLVDAILFALYGKARKRPERLISDLADNMHVHLTFHHNNNVYRVERYLERDKNQKLWIYCEANNLTERKGLVTPNQQKLNDILNIGYDLLLSTAVAQQDDINKLSAMTPGDREQIINEMLNNKIWEVKKKKIGDILNSYKDHNEVAKNIKQELTSLNNEVLKYNELIKNKIQILEQLKHEFVVLSERQNILTHEMGEWNKYKTLELLITDKKATLKNIFDKWTNLPKASTTELTQIITKIQNKIEAIKQAQELSKDGLDIIEKQINETAEWEYEARQLCISEAQTKILDEVPCKGLEIHSTCKLLSTALDIQKQINQLKQKSGFQSVKELQLEKRKELDKLITQKHDINKYLLTITKNIGELELELSQHKTMLEEVLKAQDLQERIAKLTLEIKDLKTKLKDTPKFDPIQFTLNKSELDKVSAEIHNIDKKICYDQGTLREIEKNITQLTNELDDHERIAKQLANFQILYKAYSDIPSYLFNQAIEPVEYYANEILEKIFPEERIELRSFRETQKNTLQKSLDVVSRTNTGGRDFEDLSGSERFRQSLALRIALARYNSEINNAQIGFFIIDEGFGSLDDDNIFSMQTFLNQIASNFDLFLVITHLNELKDSLQSQIIVNTTGKHNKLEIH